MERWCPRCEWVGTAGAERAGTAGGERVACPVCGASLLEVEPAPPRAATRLPTRPPAAESPAMTPAPPSIARPPATVPDAIAPAGHADDPVLRRRRGGRWRRTTATATVVLLAAGAAVGARALRTPPPAGTASPRQAPAPPLPARLAYLVSGLEGGPGGRLYFAPGDGGRFPRKDVHGTAIPAERASDLGRGGSVPAPSGTRSATWFDWSPDGDRVAVLGTDGSLRLVPDGRLLGRSVLSWAFAPDGGRIALCVGGTGGPRILVRRLEGEGRVPGAVAGCDPAWSPDGRFVAYRTATPAGRGAARSFGLLDLQGPAARSVPWRWPVAWAPTPAPDELALTAASQGGDEVLRIDPSSAGRRSRVLVSSFTLRRLADDRRVGPIDALAWSNDGRLLAVGLDGGPGAVAGLAVLDAGLGTGSFFAWPTGPSLLTWGRGNRLLAEFDRPGSKGVLEVTGTRRTTRLPGLSEVSWSPDGRWILGRSASGWTATEAAHPGRRVRIGLDSSSWSLARWCCPAVPAVRTVPQP